jgi:hypothetical protein
MSKAQKPEEEFAKKLKVAREHIHVLRSMLTRSQQNIKKQTELAGKAQAELDALIFELTGDEFYKGDEKNAKQ